MPPVSASTWTSRRRNSGNCFRPLVLTQGHIRRFTRVLLGLVILGVTTALLLRHGSVRNFVDQTAENAKTKLPAYRWALSGAAAPSTTTGPTWPWRQWQEPHWEPSAANGTGVSEEAAYLNYLVYRFRLSSDVSWLARRIRPEHDEINGDDHHPPYHHDRPSLAKVAAKFTPDGFTMVRAEATVPDAESDDSESETDVWIENEPPVEPSMLRVPVGYSARPGQIDALALLFGISTTYARLSHAGFELAANWARWLTDGHGHSNGAGLLLSLHRAQPAEAASAAQVLQRHGIDVHLVVDEGSFDSNKNKSGDGYNDLAGHQRPDPIAVRYANLLQQLQQYGDGTASPQQRRFYALVDDDVFFPSMDRLLGRLLRHDSGQETRDIWLGFPSMESDWTTVEPMPTGDDDQPSIPMTYGGGAVFLSPSLAARMADLPCLRRSTDALHAAMLHASVAIGTVDAHDGQPWPEHLHECATAALPPSVQLRIVPSFYTPADAAVYMGDDNIHLLQQYTGGLQPLALHGFRRQHRFDAGRGHRVTDVCGEDCFLQRFAFRDGWILVNGHSLERYDGGLRAEPLRRADADADADSTQGSGVVLDTLHRLLGGESRVVSDLRSDDRPETAAEQHRRHYQQQQQFWSSKRVVVEDAERPRDVRIVRGRRGQTPDVWQLVDAYTAADGSLWQTYLKRRTIPRSGIRSGPDDDEDADTDVDSVIVLMWEG